LLFETSGAVRKLRRLEAPLLDSEPKNSRLAYLPSSRPRKKLVTEHEIFLQEGRKIGRASEDLGFRAAAVLVAASIPDQRDARFLCEPARCSSGACSNNKNSRLVLTFRSSDLPVKNLALVRFIPSGRGASHHQRLLVKAQVLGRSAQPAHGPRTLPSRWRANSATWKRHGSFCDSSCSVAAQARCDESSDANVVRGARRKALRGGALKAFRFPAS
jgi:hypothetical protein